MTNNNDEKGSGSQSKSHPTEPQSSLAPGSKIATQKRTEILYGAENAVGKGVEFMTNVKSRMDLCFDSRAPSIVIEVPEYYNGYTRIKKMGGRIRVVTDITKDNLHYCKRLMDLAELRHLPGIRGGIAVNESEYMATTVLEEAKPLTEVIYSNVPEMVSQGQYVFDIFWDNAVPAEQRISELELGIMHTRTRIIERKDQIIEQIAHLADTSLRLSIVSPLPVLLSGQDNVLFAIYRQIFARTGVGSPSKTRHGYDAEQESLSHQRNELENVDNDLRGIRWVTRIDKDVLESARKLVSIGVKVRHVASLPPLNFTLGDKEVNSSIDMIEGGKVTDSLLTSNDPAYLKHFEGIFERLWTEGMDAEQRMHELETGIESADFEIVKSSRESIVRAWETISSAKKEVLILLSTPNAFRRQLSAGALDVLRAASLNGSKIRILIPADVEVERLISDVRTELPSIDLRAINESLKTNITIVIIDSRECIIFELKDDNLESSFDAIGTTLFSKSKSIVSSYSTIIESLWTETQLYEKIKAHDQMQRDFLNLASHELRTPIQPIIGLADLLSSRVPKNSEDRKWVDTILRNANRLNRLTESILDLTKIESKSLHLEKEIFDLPSLIRSVVSDYILSPDAMAKSSVKIGFLEKGENIGGDFGDANQITVFGDKTRIYEVLWNLLNNATKFTDYGTITVSIQIQRVIDMSDTRNDILVEEKLAETWNSETKDDSALFAIVAVTDTGEGIDPAIQQHLFSKFVSKSASGTGIGLYISKAITEAHGGRIWGQNNKNGLGAEFGFSLPLAGDNDQ